MLSLLLVEWPGLAQWVVLFHGLSYGALSQRDGTSNPRLVPKFGHAGEFAQIIHFLRPITNF